MDQKPFTQEEIDSFLKNNSLDAEFKKNQKRFYPYCLIGLNFEEAKEQAEKHYGKKYVELLHSGQASFMDSFVVTIWVEVNEKEIITRAKIY